MDGARMLKKSTVDLMAEYVYYQGPNVGISDPLAWVQSMSFLVMSGSGMAAQLVTTRDASFNENVTKPPTSINLKTAGRDTSFLNLSLSNRWGLSLNSSTTARTGAKKPTAISIPTTDFGFVTFAGNTSV